MRKGVLGGLVAVILCVPVLLSAPPTTSTSGFVGQAAIAEEARKGQYVFILFSREDDFATQAVRLAESVPGLALLVALVATYVLARPASRLDPCLCLREV